MTDASTAQGHGGDAGTDEPDVGQTSAEDLPQEAAGAADVTDDQASGARDDDMASGHLGEPGGPAWARDEGQK